LFLYQIIMSSANRRLNELKKRFEFAEKNYIFACQLLADNEDTDSFEILKQAIIDAEKRLISSENDLMEYTPNQQYWKIGRYIDETNNFLGQIEFEPINEIKPNLDTALVAAEVDCGPAIHQLLKKYNALNILMTAHPQYALENQVENKREAINEFFSCTFTRFFIRDKPITQAENSYQDTIRILTNRIKEINFHYLKLNSQLCLISVFQLTLKYAK
jgi:hypothetical protein